LGDELLLEQESKKNGLQVLHSYFVTGTQQVTKETQTRKMSVLYKSEKRQLFFGTAVVVEGPLASLPAGGKGYCGREMF
jgi:hypothetical protein